MNERTVIDYDDVSLIGLDVEKEDTQVGIFGNTFFLVFVDNKTKVQHQIVFNDDQAYDLFAELKLKLSEIRHGDI